MKTFVKVDSVPLYIQLKNYFREAIDRGDLKSGEKIPSEAELQNTYEMSRVTIRKAVEELVKEGYLIKIQGKGTFVSQVADFESAKNIYSFTKLCQMQGKSTESEVCLAELIKGTEEQLEFFELPSGSEVMCIKRIRKVENIPVVLETNYFHPVYEFLKYDDLTHSLYEILINKYHVLPAKKGLNKVSIMNVTGGDAELLHVKDGMPTIYNKVHIYDTKGKPVHTVEEIVRVDMPEIFKYFL